MSYYQGLYFNYYYLTLILIIILHIIIIIPLIDEFYMHTLIA
jgi:hypothetical protein